MKPLQKLERLLRPVAIPNLAIYLLLGQGICWVAIHAQGDAQAQEALAEKFLFMAQKVLNGEAWRLISFIFYPPSDNPLWLFFAFYIFWTMSSALESRWGAARFNLYLLIGYVMTVASAFISPAGVATNGFLGGSVFLAFAFLWPDYVFYIFFILPVRVKWLALITWALYAFTLITGPMIERLMVLAATANFLLFFWRDILQRVKTGRHRMKHQIRAIKSSRSDEQAFHTCAACGLNDRTAPTMEFRYCSDCKPSQCFCANHIAHHQHIQPNQVIGLK
jgi:hypothetical protein